MSKQDQIAREKKEQEAGVTPDNVLVVFEAHYRLALKSMTREHAAASAHNAVQLHLASARELQAERQAEQETATAHTKAGRVVGEIGTGGDAMR